MFLQWAGFGDRPITAYADSTTALSLDIDMTSQALAAFYKEALGKAGWKATTDKPVRIDLREMLNFRNDAKDIATLKMHEFEGKLRATLEHRTAAEHAEAIRLAEAEEARRKAESARYARKAAEAAARDRVTFAIAVPAGTRRVSYKKDGVEFKLARSKARSAVESIRTGLLKAGWKGKAARLEPMAGTVSLDKKAGVSVVIIYMDTGFGDAEVTITAIGAGIERPKAR